MKAGLTFACQLICVKTKDPMLWHIQAHHGCLCCFFCA